MMQQDVAGTVDLERSFMLIAAVCVVFGLVVAVVTTAMLFAVVNQARGGGAAAHKQGRKSRRLRVVS